MPKLQAVLDRVLAKRPTDRPADAVALLAELDAAFAPETPVRARVPVWARVVIGAGIASSAILVVLVAALSGRPAAPAAAIPAIPPLPPHPAKIFFDTALVAQASRGKTPAERARARELAEKLELGKQVDWLSSYALDLAEEKSCRDRRDAVLALRKLGDPRAIPALKKAKGRSGGFLGLQAVNGCLRSEADEAITFLETK
jgi:hypothetical protein